MSDSPIKGCDASHFQGDIDWDKVRADGIRFAWCKASQGIHLRDERWTVGRRKAMAGAGIRWGGYHFGDLSQSASDNARNFQDALGELCAGELLPALDIEAAGIPPGLDGNAIAKWMVDFAAAFTAGLPRPGEVTFAPPPLVAYVGMEFLGRLHQAAPALQLLVLHHFPFLWIPRYTSAASPGDTRPWPTWAAWQTTARGHVNGIRGDDDLDVVASEDVLYALTIPDPDLAGPGQ